MTRIELLVPVVSGEVPSAAGTLAPRLGVSPGARLTLIDNGKPKARLLMQYVAVLLQDRLSLRKASVHTKGSASRVISEAEAAELVATSDLVIAGLGDCGACSVCSVGDALRMELAGVPSTVLISDVFVGHVASFAASQGFAAYRTVAVPHPVSSKSDDQLAAFAGAVVDDVVDQLTCP